LRKKSAKLTCYCHTPPRYLYGLATARDPKKYPILNAILQVLFHFFRLRDFVYAQNVDQFVANSKTTASRIKKYYRRPSLVINPPIRLPVLSSASKRQSFYLAGGRLARAKRYDLAIRACNQLKLPLKIFGRNFAGHQAELKKIAGPTIEFLGEITDRQKSNLMSTAKAFIFCSDNEDFGIVPVEAMAHGCPVIGHNSGGTAETIVNGKTGVLFDHLTVPSLVSAIKKLNTLLNSYPSSSSVIARSSATKQSHSCFISNQAISKACITRARQFSCPVFIQKIKKPILSF